MLPHPPHSLSKSYLATLKNNTAPATLVLRDKCTHDFTNEDFMGAIASNHSVKIIELDSVDKRTVDLVGRWLILEGNKIHGLALHLIPSEAESTLIDALLHKHCGVKYLGLSDIGNYIKGRLPTVFVAKKITGLTFSQAQSMRYMKPLLQSIRDNHVRLTYMSFVEVNSDYLVQAAALLGLFSDAALASISLYLFDIRDSALSNVSALATLPVKKIVCNGKLFECKPNSAPQPEEHLNGIRHFQPRRPQIPLQRPVIPMLDLKKSASAVDAVELPKL